jgi:hypothetical protein
MQWDVSALTKKRNSFRTCEPFFGVASGNTNVERHRIKFLLGLVKNTALGLRNYDSQKIRNFSLA